MCYLNEPYLVNLLFFLFFYNSARVILIWKVNLFNLKNLSHSPPRFQSLVIVQLHNLRRLELKAA